MLRFKNIFAEKNSETKQTFTKEVTIVLVFMKFSLFRKKRSKIAENSYQNIDPGN
jgi:hypothetical protein